jgi:hypothetical protein
MRRGYPVVASGGQGDTLPGEGRLTIQVPIAQEHGRPITEVVWKSGLGMAYGWGRLQSGRFLREFVYRGFN